jgi:hypothetical protein
MNSETTSKDANHDSHEDAPACENPEFKYPEEIPIWYYHG